MKKLLSIILTVAMLASMLSVPMVVGAKEYTAGNMTLKLGDFTGNGGLFGLANDAVLAPGNVIVTLTSDGAYNAYDIVSENVNTLYYANDGTLPSALKANVTTVSGIGGKSKEDKSAFVESDAAQAYDGNVMINLSNFYTKSKKYLVMEANMNPVDAEYDMTGVSVHTNGHAVIAAAHKLNIGEWNKYLMYVDFEANKTYVYVNGELVGENAPAAALLNEKTTLRFCFNGVREGEVPNRVAYPLSLYVDDMTWYETDTAPDGVALTAKPELAPSDKYILTEGKIFAQATTTVADIKTLNKGAKVYKNISMDAYADDSEVVGLGMIIVLEGANKAISTYPVVAETSSTKDVITGFPASVTRGAVADAEGNVYGRVSDTMKVVTGPTGDGNWYTQHNYKTPGANMNYLVVETDVAPSADVTRLFLGTNGHAHLSQSVYVGEGSDIAPEKWSKVALVYNIAEEVCDVYVNGKLVSKGVANSFAAMQNCLRFVVYSDSVADCYIDNYKIYESAVYPEIDAPAAFENGYASALNAFVDNKSGIVSIPAGIDAGVEIEGYDITVFDSEYNAVSGEISEGNIVFIQKDGSYAYYTIDILEDNDIVVIGDTYSAKTGIMTVGDITVYGVTDEEAKLVVAQYDDEGKMIKTAVSETGSGVLEVEFTSEELDDSKVKAFLLKNGQLKPLCKNAEITHSMVYNMLMLGNSFSRDVTCYMEDVATAQGKDFNVHVLNKGGSSVNYHYENREIDLEKSELNLFISGVHVGKSNLKTLLETYDYDYVIMQNWGADVAFYANTDANYEANWAVFADLAKYINENEPEAELMLHETWSFEAGYNSWTDAAVRDEAGANIRAVYDRCAADIKAELGLDYDVRKISSLDAFEAARAYENAEGVKMFDTTYDGSKHEFAGTEVAVGDGSMLLGDEDAAAGKVSLYRDGFHASAAARYLIALNAVQFITGKSVNGNTFRPGSIRLDSAGRYMDTGADMSMSSGTVYQTYDPLSEDVVTTLQTIADSIR